MARFEVKQSGKLQLTSYSGLALVGQCSQIAPVDTVIDSRIPVSQGMRTSDLVKSLVGLLTDDLGLAIVKLLGWMLLFNPFDS